MSLEGLSAEMVNIRQELDRAWSTCAIHWNDPVSARFADGRLSSLKTVLDNAADVLTEADFLVQETLQSLEALSA